MPPLTTLLTLTLMTLTLSLPASTSPLTLSSCQPPSGPLHSTLPPFRDVSDILVPVPTAPTLPTSPIIILGRSTSSKPIGMFVNARDFSPLSSSIQLHDPTASGTYSYPIGVVDPNSGNIYIAYSVNAHSNFPAADGSETYIRAFDADLNPLSPEIWVNGASYNHAYTQAPGPMAVTGDGNVVVTSSSWDGSAVVGVYTPNLASIITDPQRAQIPSTTNVDNGIAPSAFTLSSGDVAVVYTDTSSAHFVRKILADGTFTATHTQIMAGTTNYAFVRGEGLPSGGLVVMGAQAQGAGYYLVGVQTLDADFNIVLPTTLIVSPSEFSDDTCFTRDLFTTSSGFAVLYSEPSPRNGVIRSFAYTGIETSLESPLSSLDTGIDFDHSGNGVFEGAKMVPIPDIGDGSAMVVVKLDTNSPGSYATICYPQDLVLSPFICDMMGTPAFSLSCLDAAFANTTFTTRYDSFVLPPGTWTQCLPSGVSPLHAVNIRGGGSSPSDTIVDCEGSGMFLTLDTDANALAPSSFESMTIEGLTLRGGNGVAVNRGGMIDVVHASPGPILRNLVIQGSQGHQGGGVRWVNSAGTIADIVVSDCTSSSGGGGIAVVGNSAAPVPALIMSITQMAIFSCTTQSGDGGGLLVQMPLDGHPSLSLSLTSTNISSSSAPQGCGGGVGVSGLFPFAADALVVRDSTSRSGGGLCVWDVGSVAVTSSLLSGNTATSFFPSEGGGGARVFVQQRGNLVESTWTDVVFEGNTATSQSGGGLLSTDVAVSLTSCTLTSNSAAKGGGGLAFNSLSAVPRALLIHGSSLSSNTASEYGGGLAMWGGSGALTSTSMGSNMGGQLGGALYVTNAGLVELGAGCVVSGNVAGTAGSTTFECRLSPTCGAAPTLCDATLPRPSALDTSLIAWDAGAYSASGGAGGVDARSDAVSVSLGPGVSTVLESVVEPSGSNPVPGMVFGGADVFGNPASVGDELMISLRPVGAGPGTLLTPADVDFLESNFDVAGGTCVLDDNNSAESAGGGGGGGGSGGVCTIPSLRLYARSENATRVSVQLALSLSAAECVSTLVASDVRAGPCRNGLQGSILGGRYSCIELCSLGTFLNISEETGTSVCSPCPRGTFQGSPVHQDPVCKACASGSYSFTGASECTPCPLGGECGSGGFLHAARGYWYPYGSDADAIHIPEFFQCPSTGESCPGGPVYSACSSTYDSGSFLCSSCVSGAAKVGTRCQNCWPMWAAMVGAVVMVVVVVGLGVYLIRKASQGTQTQSLVLKIGLSYLQLLAMASGFKSQTSALFETFASGASSGAMLSVDFFALVCVTEHTFYDQVVFYLVLPAVLAVVSRGVYAVLYGKRGGKGGVLRFLCMRGPPSEEDDGLYKDHAAASLQATTISIFMIYPTVVRNILLVYHCQEYGGELRLLANLDEVCYTGTHARMAIVAGFGVCLYIVGIPVVGFLYFRWQKAKLGDDDAFRARHRFLLDGYKPSAWAMELFIMARKSVVVAVVVFVDSEDLQVTVGTTIVLVLGVLVNARLRPFEMALLNYLEEAALSVIVITIAAGAALRDTSDASDVSKDVVVYTLIALNCSVIAMLVVFWIRARLGVGTRKVLPQSQSDEDGGLIEFTEVSADGSGYGDSRDWSSS